MTYDEAKSLALVLGCPVEWDYREDMGIIQWDESENGNPEDMGFVWGDPDYAHELSTRNDGFFKPACGYMWDVEEAKWVKVQEKK